MPSRSCDCGETRRRDRRIKPLLGCTTCNRAKGSDIGSIAGKGEFTRFFNPRTDRWSDHFALNGIEIVTATNIAEVTVGILGINHPNRLLERTMLSNVGRYPPEGAKSRLDLRLTS